MKTISTIFFSLTLFTTAFAAPTQAAADSDTLLANARAAQGLNSQFATLKLTDSCNTGESACISNATVSCVDGKWTKQTDCTGSQLCVALPSVRGNGTVGLLPL